jgi:hypothetical protein
MPIAAGLVVAALLSAPASSPAARLPAISVSVMPSTDLPPALVSALLDEASAIWSAAGVRLEWRRGDEAAGGIRVLIGGGGPPTNEPVPLGWIAFDDDGRPAPQIFISYTNALTLLSGARGAAGRVQWMTLAQQRIYLARALGRALAHELGHYLFASKLHTATGLMKARHSSTDLFGPDRRPFEIDRSQRDGLAARFARRIRAAIG